MVAKVPVIDYFLVMEAMPFGEAVVRLVNLKQQVPRDGKLCACEVMIGSKIKSVAGVINYGAALYDQTVDDLYVARKGWPATFD